MNEPEFAINPGDPYTFRGAGTRAYAGPAILMLAVLAVLSLLTFWAPPAGRTSWLLEVAPGLAGVAVLVGVYRRFPMSYFVYGCVLLHVFILIYGGVYTYAETPLGNWAKAEFGLSRNHYDRVGHIALGFFPVFAIRETLVRRTPLRPGAWLTFLMLSVVLAIAAFWELLEWWVTLLVASDVGVAFLGSQGDIWDAQWDMFLALVGAACALPIFSRTHDRSIAKIPREPPSPAA